METGDPADLTATEPVREKIQSCPPPPPFLPLRDLNTARRVGGTREAWEGKMMSYIGES